MCLILIYIYTKGLPPAASLLCFLTHIIVVAIMNSTAIVISIVLATVLVMIAIGDRMLLVVVTSGDEYTI